MFAYCQDMPGLTEEDARKVEDAVGAERAEGNVVHVSGPYEGGWRVIDVWESREALHRFQQERLFPALDAVHGTTAAPADFEWREVTSVFQQVG